jgi:ribonuclease P/MRP protein subunit RPP40
LEKVQKRATKMIKAVQNLVYVDRLKYLNLPTLKFRRVRGDMIEVFKIISGIYDSNLSKDLSLVFNISSNTRGNSCKLYQLHSKYDLHKFFFSNRVVCTWNSLPEHVVSAPNVDIFKNRLDR